MRRSKRQTARKAKVREEGAKRIKRGGRRCKEGGGNKKEKAYAKQKSEERRKNNAAKQKIGKTNANNGSLFDECKEQMLYNLRVVYFK